MIQKGAMRLVEICPQCRRGVDASSARLVSDVCGHPKCRICLLQEINGCLKCASTSKDRHQPSGPVTVNEMPARKSVIMSTVDLQGEQHDKSTRQVIQQSMQKDILFPTDIVKRSTGNFFHLKRLISERYYNEGGGKEDKSCATDPEAVTDAPLLAEQLPGHIVHYCAVHRKTLTGETAIENHRNCDGGGKPNFVCDICDKTFVNSYKLNRHRHCHEPAPRFQCQVCSKKFKDNYALTTHKRMHTGHKAFTCHICHIQLKQLWSLKRHLAAHKGEKNYPCDSCNYRFVTKTELTRHMKLHLNPKAFSCSTCGARFSCHRSLVRHAMCHNRAATPLCCRHCGAAFKRKDNLLRHEKNTHVSEDAVSDRNNASKGLVSELDKTVSIGNLKDHKL